METNRGRRRGRPAAPASSSSTAAADPRERLHACIDRLTRSGRPSLDPADSSELKRLCRTDQQLVDLAHSLLCHRLVQGHAQVRLSAFQIVDLLFRRSRRFRELVLDRFEKLVGAVLIDNEADSPPPKPVSVFRQLGDLALEAFIDWHENYSSEHPKLVFAFRFLSQAHSARLSQVRARLASTSAERLAEARRLAEKKRDLLAEARQQFQDEEVELDACLATVANCLELLVPRPESFDVNALTSSRVATSSAAAAAADAPDLDVGSVDEADFEAATEDERRRLHGILGSTTACGAVSAASASSTGGGISVQLRLARPSLRETPDNAELLEALQTRADQLRKKMRPRLARWLAVAERCGDEAEAAQLRAQLTQLLARSDWLLGQAQSLRIVRRGDGDGGASADCEEDEAPTEDEFEAVDRKEGFETEAPESAEAAAAPKKPESTAAAAAGASSSKPSSSSLATSSSTSSKVPTVPFGLDLLHWGAKDAAAELGSATIGYRMDDGGHSMGYRPLDGDESFEISGSRHILTLRTMVYSTPDEPVRWACRHPLPSGGLCARMDRLKCPFHGRIVPRDADGRPTAADDETPAAEAAEPLKKKTKLQKKKKQQQQPEGDGGLVNIRALVDNSRSRLASRVASKAALRRAAEDEAARRRRKMQEKFGDQFQYQFLN